MDVVILYPLEIKPCTVCRLQRSMVGWLLVQDAIAVRSLLAKDILMKQGIVRAREE